MQASWWPGFVLLVVLVAALGYLAVYRRGRRAADRAVLTGFDGPHLEPDTPIVPEPTDPLVTSATAPASFSDPGGEGSPEGDGAAEEWTTQGEAVLVAVALDEAPGFGGAPGATVEADGPAGMEPLAAQVVETQPQEEAMALNDPLIKTNVVIGEGTKQFMRVSDITLTPPAVKVREIRTTVTGVTTHVIAGKVIVQGTIHKQIFYVSADGLVHHLAEDVPFSEFVEVPQVISGLLATDELHVQTSFTVEDVIRELRDDGATLHQKVVIDMFVKVTAPRQVNVILADTGPLYKVELVVGENTKQLLVEADLVLSRPALKIVDVVVEVRNVTCEVITDKVVYQGQLHKQVFYIDLADGTERHQAFDVDFSDFIDVPGALAGQLCQVHPTVEDVFDTLSADGTSIHEKVMIEFLVKVAEEQQLMLSPGGTTLLKLERVVGETTAQILVEDVVPVTPPAQKIESLDTTVRDVSSIVLTDKVVVQGNVHQQIFYVDTGNIVHEVSHDIPFSAFADVAGAVSGMNVQVSATVAFQEAVVEPGGATIRVKKVIDLLIKVTETIQEFIQNTGIYY